MEELLYKSEVYAIIGAAKAVYNELGPGFLEAVYQEALEIEFSDRGILYEAQPSIQIIYKGRRLKKFYIPDFLLYGKIVVELKAEKQLCSSDEAQLLNELKATGMDLGLLINFGADTKLDWCRRALTNQKVNSRRLVEISG